MAWFWVLFSTHSLCLSYELAPHGSSFFNLSPLHFTTDMVGSKTDHHASSPVPQEELNLLRKAGSSLDMVVCSNSTRERELETQQRNRNKESTGRETRRRRPRAARGWSRRKGRQSGALCGVACMRGSLVAVPCTRGVIATAVSTCPRLSAAAQ